MYIKRKKSRITVNWFTSQAHSNCQIQNLQGGHVSWRTTEEPWVWFKAKDSQAEDTRGNQHCR